MKQNFTVRQGALDGVEAFLSVAQHRSFRRAAAELGVTPSAIRQAVRALEGRVGAALFLRTTRSVGLTEAGERFLVGPRVGEPACAPSPELVRHMTAMGHSRRFWPRIDRFRSTPINGHRSGHGGPAERFQLKPSM
jgi:hypothetical protein